MRIRRKKFLKERLEKVSKRLAVIDKEVINVNDALRDKKYLDLKGVFNNDNPLCLDIGCGKGGFVCEIAKKNNDINYLGIEMMENIILLAAEKAEADGLNNLAFINTGAEYLPRYLQDKSVSEIYLNFSPPYPQNGHENRRLTNDRFLSVYKSLLADGGKIFIRTDDKNFFDYSCEKMKDNGFKVLIKNDNPNGIFTEYEKKFLEKGLKIYYASGEKL